MKQNKITSQGMRIMAGTLTIVLLGTTIVSPIPVHAAETAGGKEEVIYVMTDAEGKVESVNVVNIFGKGDVTDYGDYSSVKMLTSTEPITQAGDKITFSTQKEKVYYQGTLENAQIPWNIDITYKLDGKEVSPEKLAGQSGTLEIRILITENTAADDNFYDNYALQAAFTLDSTKCENIVASGATLANVGSDKQISYTVLPGKGLDAVITADVVDFEMDAAAINGLKLDLNIEVDDSELMDKVAEIQDATTDLNDGAKDLKDGAGDLNDGAKDLKEGAGDLNDGAKDLNDGAKDLYDGVNSLDDGINSLSNGISTVQEGLNTLNGKSTDLTGGSSQVQTALKTIQSSLNDVAVSTDQLKMLTDSSAAIKQGISDLYNGAATLQAAVSYDSYKTTMQANGLDIDALVAKNAGTITQLQAQVEQMQATLDGIKQIPGYESDAAYAAQAAQLEQQISSLNGMIQLLQTNNDAWNGAMSGTENYFQGMSRGVENLVTGLNELQTKYAAFDTAIGELVNQLSGLAVNMTKLKGGIDQLVTQYGTLDSGIQEYTTGVATIVSGYSQLTDGAGKLVDGSKELLDGSSDLKQGTVDLYDGTQELYDGTVDLYDGTQELYDGTVDMQDGTKEFYDKTYDMDTEVRDKIDDMLADITGSDEPVVSFVSDKNENVNSVQFVIKTTAIEKEDVEETVAQEETTTGFFQKLIALFKKQ